MAADRVNSFTPFPGFSEGVEECWTELEGARMRYLRAGPAKSPSFDKLRTGFLAKNARNGAPGPALILLHGLLGYSFSWRFAMPALAPYATVYAPDMMGAGFSDRADVDYSMRGTARRLLRFIRGLGVSSFDLLGTSHGGAVAMMAAEECLSGNFGLHLERLILVAPVNPYSAHGRRLAPFFGSNFGSALFRRFIPRMNLFYPYWHARMYGDRERIPAGTLEGYKAPLAKPGLFDHALSIVRTWTADLRELETVLPKLANVPTLLMWGSKDTAVYASSAERLAKFFPNSESIVFPGIGHLPYEECPEEFNRAVIGFLTRGETG
ncbi:MAG TPA: alpha/beta hydrolase [Candidatus Aquilonibacter sp.]|jgi:pimeloyl-ACP methyl ester carboxylesterase|nr:alpha/beta hydrolase [Candidatus Aquilonibacter sp.]